MSTRIVLQNAISQLEAQKNTTYQKEKEAKLLELQPQLSTYLDAKQKEKEEAIGEVTKSFTEAIAAKKNEINNIAEVFAATKVAAIDKTINEIKKLVDNAAED